MEDAEAELARINEELALIGHQIEELLERQEQLNEKKRQIKDTISRQAASTRYVHHYMCSIPHSA